MVIFTTIIFGGLTEPLLKYTKLKVNKETMVASSSILSAGLTKCVGLLLQRDREATTADIHGDDEEEFGLLGGVVRTAAAHVSCNVMEPNLMFVLDNQMRL